MATNLRDFIQERRREILEQISALKIELQELKLAEAAIHSGTPSQTAVRRSDEDKPTIKEMILGALEGRKEGADAIKVITLIRQEYGEDVERSSLSPQLTRLRREGKVTLNNGIWKLSEFIDGTTSDEAAPSTELGGGLVQAPDFPIEPPEGASPSTSTTYRQDFKEILGDDIPF